MSESYNNFKTLLTNIHLYYNEEKDFILKKIDSCETIINKLIYTKNFRKIDIYNLTFVLEEIKYSTSYHLSSRTTSLSYLIYENIAKINNLKEYKGIVSSLLSLKRLLKDYKETINKDFLEKILDIETKDINDLALDLFSKLAKNNISFTTTDNLIALYIKTIENPENSSLTKNYEDFFRKLKTFLKETQHSNKLISLNENPILNILRLAYLIKNGFYKENSLSQSDILLIKAYFSHTQDIKKLNTIDNKLNRNPKICTLSSIIKENYSVESIPPLINFIDFQLFAISQYFLDFSINQIFFPKDQDSDILKKPKTLQDSIKDLINLPNLIFNENALYDKLNKKPEIYNNFFINYDNRENTEIILENSPSKLLTEVANNYFWTLLNVATSINILLIKNDLKLLEPFIKFEKYFNTIKNEISKKISINSQILNTNITSIIKIGSLIGENYLILKEKEERLIKDSNFDDSSDVYQLSGFMYKKNFLSYKEIMTRNQQNNKDVNFEESLKNINKSIINNKIKKAEENAKKLSIKILSETYYHTPILIGVDNLPPVSHNYFLIIKKVTNNPTIDNIKNMQETYWKV